MSELDNLLSRLPSTEETRQSVTFEGRALSRDDDHLHLATASGVIAIPIAEIEEVRHLVGRSDDVVSVDVRNGDRIKHIRRVIRTARGFGGFGGFGGTIGGVEGDTVTGEYLDTATVTGGTADATDDTFWIEQVDDQPA
jgi:hypothetical protein